MRVSVCVEEGGRKGGEVCLSGGEKEGWREEMNV